LDSTFKLSAPKFWIPSEITDENFCNFPAADALNSSPGEGAEASFSVDEQVQRFRLQQTGEEQVATTTSIRTVTSSRKQPLAVPPRLVGRKIELPPSNVWASRGSRNFNFRALTSSSFQAVWLTPLLVVASLSM
jgi:hypothetical protein